MSELLHYSLGGLVPGPLGKEVFAVVHGGERVVTPQQVVPLQPIRVGGSTGGGTGSVIHVGDINVPLHLDGARFGPELDERDVQHIAKEAAETAVGTMVTILEGVG